MPNTVKCNAIVLSEAVYGETDKMLTAISDRFGKISVSARGAKKNGSPFLAAAQQFCYSSMELSCGKNGIYSLKEAELIQSFYGLRNNIDAFFAASDVGKLALTVSQEEYEDEELLRLLLNTLYFLAEGNKNPELVTDIFKLRLVYEQGFLNPEAVRREGTRKALEHIVSSDYTRLFSFGVSEEILNELTGLAGKAVRSMLEGV